MNRSNLVKLEKNVSKQGHYHTGPQPTRCRGTDRLKTFPAVPTISMISPKKMRKYVSR